MRRSPTSALRVRLDFDKQDASDLGGKRAGRGPHVTARHQSNFPLASHTEESASTHVGARERVLSALLHCADPRNWPRLVRRVTRNPEFFADLLEYAQADPAPRRRALKRIVRHLYRRALEGDTEDWLSSTKGYAAELISRLHWLEPQLRATPHLGALRVGSAHASRWDYTLLINHQLLGLKQEFAGYGLGASARPECWLPSTRRLSLLEVTQVWSLLTNAGHLFGTFATERGLLFELFRMPGREDAFLEAIHIGLRDDAARILRAHSLYDMHYVLACWRVSRAPMDPTTRDDCIALLRAFFECRRDPHTPAHYGAFRTARQLAYNRMHLYMGVGHPVDVVHDDMAIRAMSPWADLGYEPQLVAESSLLGAMLKTLDAYQFENHFASADVASDVLQHVRAFRRWWKGRAVLTTAVDDLFGEPPGDWPSIDRRDLSHFSRLKLLGRADEWLNEVRTWLDDPDERHWKAGNFLITPRTETGLIADVYVRAGEPPQPATLRHVATQLARHCIRSWDGDPNAASRELWRSIAVFGLSALGLATKPGRRPLLRPVELHSRGQDDGHVGYALASSPAASGLERARLLAPRVNDEAHRRELLATIEVADETAKAHESEPMLLFLGSTYLVDAKRAQREVAEFDGAWCFFGSGSVTWFLLEHKKTRSTDRELNRKLKHLTPSSEPYDVQRQDIRGRLSVARVVWSPAAAPSANFTRSDRLELKGVRRTSSCDLAWHADRVRKRPSRRYQRSGESTSNDGGGPCDDKVESDVIRWSNASRTKSEF
jgi:hypothetical protein